MNDFHLRPTKPGEGRETGSFEEPAKVPSSINGYQIESLLEKGGMSLVYLAIHPKTNDRLTIKVLSPKYLSNPEVMTRFLREAEIIGIADHPNIVKLYSQGEWEGGLYIAMEYIQGVSLRQYLQKNAIPLKTALEISLQIAYALCHLHSHGVIHRDLKPENILLTKEGSIKVIDFGIAQVLTESTPEGPRVKRIIGTPVYMSPEQQKNPDGVSYPSDIYSLGIIIYELVLNQLCHGKVHLSLMPKKLQPILSKCLQPRPGDRYQDIVELIAELSEYMNSESLKIDQEEEDTLHKLTSEMEKKRLSLIPPPPKEFGLAYLLKRTSPGFFLEPLGEHSLLLGTAGEGEIEGLAANSSLKEGIKLLHGVVENNQLLAHLDTRFSYRSKTLLFLSRESEVFVFQGIGRGSLWQVEARNAKSIPIESPQTLQRTLGLFWFYTNLPGEAFAKINWEEILKENKFISPQQSADSLLKRLAPLFPEESKDLLILVFS